MTPNVRDTNPQLPEIQLANGSTATATATKAKPIHLTTVRT